MVISPLIVFGAVFLLSCIGTFFVIGLRRTWSYSWGGGLFILSGAGALYLGAVENWLFAGLSIAFGVIAALAIMVLFLGGGGF